MFENKYPYTDFSQLNLDWFLLKFKELLEEQERVSGKVKDLDDTVKEFTDFVTNYFDNLDVQAEVNVKLNEMAADGTLSDLLAPLVAADIGDVVADQIGAVVGDQIGAVVGNQIDAVVADQIDAAVAPEIPGAVTGWLDANVDPVGSAVVVDSSLSVFGAAADAKVTGDEISDLKDDIYVISSEWRPVELTIQTDGFYNPYGAFVSDTGRKYAIVSVLPNEKYKLSTRIRSTQIPAIEFFYNNTFISYLKIGTGVTEDVTNYEFTIPAGTNKLIVQNATGDGEFSLSKYVIEKELNIYTKSEVDEKIDYSKRYGVKWNISDANDLGQRCFDAVGLSASIGVGEINGSSDFDAIYPWSEIKRCNIKANANGADIVTFEGETGFALDGSNGDVFVRIPKFYYERYQKNGYEYRVISAVGTNVHPAFIENGVELDEIFISAFEGYINGSDELESKAGVIPTSNVIAQTFLTAAQNKGDNYSLYDMRCVDVVWNLMAIEYGCRNSNRIIGYGIADYKQPVNYDEFSIITEVATNTNTIRTGKWNNTNKAFMPVGSNITVCKQTQGNILTQAKILTCVDTEDELYTDWTFDGNPIDVDTTCFIGSAALNTNFCESVPSGALSWHTGRANWINESNTRNPIRYRWIENIVGNLWHFLPDISFDGLQMYQCLSMKDYVMHKFTSPYMPVSKVFTENRDNGNKSDVPGYNYWVTELDNDMFAKGVDFGRTYDKNLTSDKAFGAYYYLYNNHVVISNGGGFDHLWRCNVLTQRAWQEADQHWYLYGARMMYKHLS